MANEKLNCNQICHWNDSSDGCIKPNGRICPMSNTEPDASGWGQVKVANEKRLIDANALIATLEKIAKEDETNYFHLDEITQEIFDAPTVDAVKVVHGRWIKTDNGVRKNINTDEMIRVYMHDCSICGWHTGNQGRNFNYCPNCGAKMDGGDEDG